MTFTDDFKKLRKPKPLKGYRWFEMKGERPRSQIMDNVARKGKGWKAVFNIFKWRF